ncbi:MAG: hypothetical protein AAF685_01495 [Cyanobacteria bacterium P01_C01_bin.89]
MIPKQGKGGQRVTHSVDALQDWRFHGKEICQLKLLIVRRAFLRFADSVDQDNWDRAIA